MLDMASHSDGLFGLVETNVRNMLAKVEAKLDLATKNLMTYTGPKGSNEAHANLAYQGEELVVCLEDVGTKPHVLCGVMEALEKKDELVPSLACSPLRWLLSVAAFGSETRSSIWQSIGT